MARIPFPSSNPPAPSPRPGPVPSGSVQSGPMPSGQAPRPGPGAPGGPGRPAPQAGERRTLVVGRGISVQGTVQDAERLVVEGTVEATMIHATELSIAPGGVVKGEIEVEDAEIAGVIDGKLTARGNLMIRGTGRVLGTARCRRLQVEDGGQISGQMEMIQGEGRPASAPAASTPVTAAEPVA